MKRSLLSVAFVAACTSPPQNLPLGTAEATVRTYPVQPNDRIQTIATAWAEVGYSAGDHGRYGALFIRFSGDTTNPAPTCDERNLLNTSALEDVYIQTAQNYASPKLPLGDIPLVSDLDAPADPTSTYATIDGLYPFISAGHVTITEFSDTHVAGTFDGTGDDHVESNHAWGSFDVPICRD